MSSTMMNIYIFMKIPCGHSVPAKPSACGRYVLMANRSLRGMGFEPTIYEILKKKKISTCEQIIGRPAIELVYELDLPLPVILDMVRLISIKISTPNDSVPTVMDLLQRREAPNYLAALPTKLPILDAYLRGGIAVGSLTEIVGPAGVGKTQFCHMLALSSISAADQDFGVFYVDTENAFSSSRLSEMLIEMYPTTPEDQLVTLIERVTVFKPTTPTQLLDTLKNIEDQLIEKNVKLLIIDSVASIVRIDFDSSSLIQRQVLLSQIVALIKYYAHELQLAVLVVNQVTSNVKEGFATPALGLTWYHSLNTRIVLDFPDVMLDENTYGEGKSVGLRQITVAKSPVAPVVTLFYHITTAGLVLLKKGEPSEEENWDDYVTDVHPWNYWNRAIAPRANEIIGADTFGD